MNYKDKLKEHIRFSVEEDSYGKEHECFDIDREKITDMLEEQVDTLLFEIEKVELDKEEKEKLGLKLYEWIDDLADEAIKEFMEDKDNG